MNWSRLGSAMYLALFLMPRAMSQERGAPETESGVDQAEWKQEFFAAATQIQIQGGETGSESFELLTKPVLNWTNPERRTAAGALYLFTLHARPQVALCLYPISENKYDIELQSLSLHSLTAQVNGQTIWEPQEPGMVFVPLPATTAIAKTLPGRLLQMRNLAKEFSAKLVPPERTAIPLRLLTTPIYRYPEPGPKQPWSDGAMFALVQGTDPEVLITIEAVAGEDQELVWQFAVARMSMVPTELRFRDEVVWKTEWAIRNRSTTYFVYQNK